MLIYLKDKINNLNNKQYLNDPHYWRNVHLFGLIKLVC